MQGVEGLGRRLVDALVEVPVDPWSF